MMRSNRRRSPIAATAALLLLIGAAPALASGEHEGGHGNDGHGQAGGHGDGHGAGHGGGHGHGKVEFGFGEAAVAAKADRTVEIVAYDNMRFEPEQITVEPGETVRFRVRNAGKMQHSFTLGTGKYHRQHDQEMMSMPAEQIPAHMDDSPNGVVVQPGQTETLTWRFSASAPIRFACHIPGHYPAGMVGMLRVGQGSGGSGS